MDNQNTELTSAQLDEVEVLILVLMDNQNTLCVMILSAITLS